MNKLKNDEIRRIELTVHGYTRQPLDVKAFARAIEAAATEPLLQRIAELEQRNSDLYEDVQRFKEHALNEKAARLELERQLEEARAVLKATGLLLHHFWCDVQMNEYSFEKLNKGMEAIDAAMQKGQT